MWSIFLSPNYVPEPISGVDLRVASLAWGFTLGLSFLTAVKAVRQTAIICQRAHRVTTYVSLVWLEMVVSTIFGSICWFFIDRRIPPSFAFFFTILTLSALQAQFLFQIIINRISILIINKKKVTYIKWGVAALITLVNISVYCLWIPARLQTNKEYIHLSNIWGRCEKAIYLTVDFCLNAYFLHLVNAKLAGSRIAKYRPLFQFNVGIMFVSLAMDVLILSTMSVKNTFVYMQLYPAAYILKLNIEISMTELISKVTTNSDPGRGQHVSSSEPPVPVAYRPWHKGPVEVMGELEGGEEKRWSNGTPVRLDIVGDGRGMEIKSPDSPTSEVSGGEYLAWVHAGHGRGDVESGTYSGRGTHLCDEHGDYNDYNIRHGEVHGLGLMDLMNSEGIAEGVILKTMETVVTITSVDSFTDPDTEKVDWDGDSGHGE